MPLPNASAIDMLPRTAPTPERLNGVARAQIAVAYLEKFAHALARKDTPGEFVDAATRRINLALEAIVGMDLATIEAMAVADLIHGGGKAVRAGRPVAEVGDAIIARKPAMACARPELLAALEGAATGRNLWPATFDAIRAAGLAGGMAKWESLRRERKKYEKAGIPLHLAPF